AIATTTYDYDASDHLIAMADPAGNRWRWTLDTLGRIIEQADPDAGTWHYDYDAAGRATAVVDARGQRTAIAYSAGRIASRDRVDGTVSFASGEARPGFANAGRLTTMIDASGVARIDYDALGRQVRVARTIAGTDYVAVKQLAPSGQVLGVTYPDGETIGSDAAPLVYDRAGRLTAIPDFVTQIAYHPAGRPIP